MVIDLIKNIHLLVLVIIQLIFASIGSVIVCSLELLKFLISKIFIFIDDNINHIVWISFLSFITCKLYLNQIMYLVNKIIEKFQ